MIPMRPEEFPMRSSEILVADDQISQGDLSDDEIRQNILNKFGARVQNKVFADQCVLMKAVIPHVRFER